MCYEVNTERTKYREEKFYWLYNHNYNVRNNTRETIPNANTFNSKEQQLRPIVRDHCPIEKIPKLVSNGHAANITQHLHSLQQFHSNDLTPAITNPIKLGI